MNTTKLSSQRINELVNGNLCSKYTLESQALAFRCVPTAVGDKVQEWLTNNGGAIQTNGRNLTGESLKNATIAQTILVNLNNVGQRVLADVRTSWYVTDMIFLQEIPDVRKFQSIFRVFMLFVHHLH